MRRPELLVILGVHTAGHASQHAAQTQQTVHTIHYCTHCIGCDACDSGGAYCWAYFATRCTDTTDCSVCTYRKQHTDNRPYIQYTTVHTVQCVKPVILGVHPAGRASPPQQQKLAAQARASSGLWSGARWQPPRRAGPRGASPQ